MQESDQGRTNHQGRKAIRGTLNLCIPWDFNAKVADGSQSLFSCDLIQQLTAIESTALPPVLRTPDSTVPRFWLWRASIALCTVAAPPTLGGHFLTMPLARLLHSCPSGIHSNYSFDHILPFPSSSGPYLALVFRQHLPLPKRERQPSQIKSVILLTSLAALAHTP
jgi:hypothetical protein